MSQSPDILHLREVGHLQWTIDRCQKDVQATTHTERILLEKGGVHMNQAIVRILRSDQEKDQWLQIPPNRLQPYRLGHRRFRHRTLTMDGRHTSIEKNLTPESFLLSNLWIVETHMNPRSRVTKTLPILISLQS